VEEDALSRTNTPGFSRIDTYDDKFYKTSQSQQSISGTGIEQLLRKITDEHGCKLLPSRKRSHKSDVGSKHELIFLD